MDIFSRLGVPKGILSDLGMQFVSECMKEVIRLLSIRQLITTPYHPMCNGLTENFNGTMKSMIKRLCSQQPRQWHRYINPLLFAYREVPQESTGFSPFELLYGRAVRGPMFILKELWTKELEEPEVKNSYQYVFELREKLEDTLKLPHRAPESPEQRQALLPPSGSQEVRKSGSQEVRKSGSQEVRKSGSQEVRKSGSQEVRKSGSQEVRKSGSQEVRKSGSQEVRKSGSQEVRKSGSQEVRKSGSQVVCIRSGSLYQETKCWCCYRLTIISS